MSLLHHRIALAGAGIAVAAITILTTTTAAAATPATTDRVQAAGGWLATQFVDGSHLPAPHGNHFDEKFGGDYFPNYGENADAIFGLAAAKVGRDKADAALRYLIDHTHGYTDLDGADGGPYDGSIGKLALAAIVLGRDPAHLGGHNLMAALAADECPSNAKKCTPGEAANIFASISESFVILAEARVGGGSAPTQQALEYFLSLQCANGGFTSSTAACGHGAADVDATSYAIMALTAAGGHRAQLHDAVAWLRGKQHAMGYWVSQHAPNTDSTGLAAAALQGAGAHFGAARHWLRSQQIPAGAPGAGALRFAGDFEPTTKSATSPSVLATAQGLTGLVNGGSLATLTARGSKHGSTLYAPTAAVSATHVQTGKKMIATGVGFAAGERVNGTVHSATFRVGHATADPSGRIKLVFRLPTHLAAGRHMVALTGKSSGLVAERRITVVAASAAAGRSRAR